MVDPKRVKKGFKIERWDLQSDVNALHDELMASVGGNRKLYLKINTNRRKGGTRRAMGRGKLKPQLVITPLHGWINILKWLEQAGYKLNARKRRKLFRRWKKGKTKNLLFKAYLSESKRDFQRRAKLQPINLGLDYPDSTGAGGSTDTGMFYFSNYSIFIH